MLLASLVVCHTPLSLPMFPVSITSFKQVLKLNYTVTHLSSWMTHEGIFWSDAPISRTIIICAFQNCNKSLLEFFFFIVKTNYLLSFSLEQPKDSTKTQQLSVWNMKQTTVSRVKFRCFVDPSILFYILPTQASWLYDNATLLPPLLLARSLPCTQMASWGSCRNNRWWTDSSSNKRKMTEKKTLFLSFSIFLLYFGFLSMLQSQNFWGINVGKPTSCQFCDY